jgi:tetratricopeptide (TPR) repeat protein
MDSLAKSYINLRKFNKAYELLNEYIEKSTIVYGKDNVTTVAYKLSLGHAFFADGRHDEAKELFQECLKISKNDDYQRVQTMSALAVCCTEIGKYEESYSRNA